MAQLLGSGVTDATLLGPNGDAAAQYSFDPCLFNDSVKDRAVSPFGEIFTVGNYDVRMCIVKFKRDGALVASECRRKVVGNAAAGAATAGAAITRWMRGEAVTPPIADGLGYDIDIDGDGVINPSRNGVLLRRGWVGFRRGALTAGLDAATQANRRAAIQMESYSCVRCGLPAPASRCTVIQPSK
ncbi:MAG: hypothetical protein EAZ21_15250 [Betaproteobacteria bacterium]|nr:MAG: hypothetical protein EAZ21_15250 [Betaproteobacteria bacterium]